MHLRVDKKEYKTLLKSFLKSSVVRSDFNTCVKNSTHFFSDHGPQWSMCVKNTKIASYKGKVWHTKARIEATAVTVPPLKETLPKTIMAVFFYQQLSNHWLRIWKNTVDTKGLVSNPQGLPTEFHVCKHTTVVSIFFFYLCWRRKKMSVVIFLSLSLSLDITSYSQISIFLIA